MKHTHTPHKYMHTHCTYTHTGHHKYTHTTHTPTQDTTNTCTHTTHTPTQDTTNTHTTQTPTQDTTNTHTPHKQQQKPQSVPLQHYLEAWSVQPMTVLQGTVKMTSLEAASTSTMVSAAMASMHSTCTALPMSSTWYRLNHFTFKHYGAFVFFHHKMN